MKLAVDTNVLVRAVVVDDPKQAAAAQKALKNATIIAIATPCLCEFVWVLRKVYRFDVEDVVAAIRALLNTSNVEMNRPAIEAGLDVLEKGGDFADGVIAYEGRWLGGETFVSFDRDAITLLQKSGVEARLLR